MNISVKTIFISILSGIEAKSILRTDILSLLLNDENVRVILFLKNKERMNMYKEEFSHPRLVYEIIDNYKYSRSDKIFEVLKHYLIETQTSILYKKIMLHDKKNYLSYLGSNLLSNIFKLRTLRSAVRFLDYHFLKNKQFDRFFNKYSPQIVFLANLFDQIEISLLREAKRRKILTIGFVNSWDKIVSKGYIRLLPNKIIVPTELVKDEVLRYSDVTADRIFISGSPQFDMYSTGEGLLSREKFFNEIGAKPEQHLVVFSPAGTSFSSSDWNMIDFLKNIFDNKIKDKIFLLVRFPPNEFFDDEKNISDRPWLHYDLPGIRFGQKRGMDWDMSKQDLLHLKNTLYHCSLVISFASSLCIDAAYFDKPIININFEIRQEKSAYKMPTWRYATEHYSKALLTGGIHLSSNEDDLIQWIHKYLDRPEIDSEKRKILAAEQCYKTDGKAGKRIAGFILSNLKR